MSSPLKKLLQEVMSYSSNFTVPDESKLVGVLTTNNGLK